MWSIFKKKSKEVKPLILLDIDGAIGPLGRAKGVEWQELHTNGWSGSIIFDQAVLAELKDLSAHCEINWLTSWQDEANSAFQELGLGPFKTHYHVEDTYDNSDRWWKGDVVLKEVRLNPKRKIVWIDDEIHRYLTEEWSEENQTLRTTLEANSLVLRIVPASDRGLTLAHFSRIRDFLEAQITT